MQAAQERLLAHTGTNHRSVPVGTIRTYTQLLNVI